ncbi:hypothetical protein GW17_00048508, partial [Ensete ventricosum]
PLLAPICIVAAAAPAQATALHAVGKGSRPYGSAASRGRCPCWRPPLQAAALAAGLPLAALQRVVATYGLAAGGCPLRSRRGQQALAAWPLAAAPCRLAVAFRARGAAATAGGRLLQGAWLQSAAPLAGGRPPLQGGWPWPCSIAPCKGFLRCENTARMRRTILRDSISSHAV